MQARAQLVVLLIAASLMTSCAGLCPGTRPYKDLKYPGYFDIGAGWGRVIDTRGTGDDDDAEGTMITFKAYPGGRWYGQLKDELSNKLRDVDRSLISILAIHHRKKADAAALKPPGTPPTLASGTVTAGQAMVDNQNVPLGFSDRALVQRAVQDKKLTENELLLLERLAEGGEDNEWYIVKERDSFWHRFAVFYGRSVADFDSGGLESEVNAIGIAWDVSPDLSLQIGRGFYELDDGGGLDSDSSIYFGVSLNLNSFRQFAAALAGLAN